MPSLERIRVHPIKSLSGTDVPAVVVRPNGSLATDREYKLVDTEGDNINGKRTARVHDVDVYYNHDSRALTLRTTDDEIIVTLPEEQAHAERWLSDTFHQPVELRRNTARGFSDRPSAGPSLISTATLETVASWFDELTADNVRRRMRANLEIAGVPAFWEDRFVGTNAPDFTIGDVTFRGDTPCGRCIVPERDPDTGTRLHGFQKQFIEKRQETLPPWADTDAFDHYYSLMTITEITDAGQQGELVVGDSVTILG